MAGCLTTLFQATASVTHTMRQWKEFNGWLFDDAVSGYSFSYTMRLWKEFNGWLFDDAVSSYGFSYTMRQWKEFNGWLFDDAVSNCKTDPVQTMMAYGGRGEQNYGFTRYPRTRMEVYFNKRNLRMH